MATGTTDRPQTTIETPATTTASRPVAAAPRRRHLTAIPRTRGLLSGLFLVVLGIWGALIPLVGPYFGYEFGSDQTWSMSWTRFWLDVLPGAVLVLGGLMLLWARNRIVAWVGGWLALVGGAWLVTGPTAALLWDGSLGANPIGIPAGSNGAQVLELLGYFYGLGALAIMIAVFALGRLSVVSLRDLEAAGPDAEYAEAEWTSTEADGRAVPAYREPSTTHETSNTDETSLQPAADEGAMTDDAPPRRRRLFSRSQ
jgi:hypothetical protein